MGTNTIVMLENSDGTSGLDEKLKGTSGAAHLTLATLISGEDQTNDVLKVEEQFGYEVVTDDAGGDKALGATGAAGDLLQRIVIPLATATGAVLVKDDTTTIMTFPAGTVAGVYEIGAISANGAWKINNLGDNDVIAIGRFT